METIQKAIAQLIFLKDRPKAFRIYIRLQNLTLKFDKLSGVLQYLKTIELVGIGNITSILNLIGNLNKNLWIKKYMTNSVLFSIFNG